MNPTLKFIVAITIGVILSIGWAAWGAPAMFGDEHPLARYVLGFILGGIYGLVAAGWLIYGEE